MAEVTKIRRVCNGVLIAIVLLSVICFVPAENVFVPVLFALFCGWAMYEFYALIVSSGRSVSRSVGIAGGMALMLITWMTTLGIVSEAIWTATLVCIIGMILTLNLVFSDKQRALDSATNTLFGFVYIAFMLSFLVRVFMAGTPSTPGWLAVYLLVVVKWGDSGGFFIGNAFGKHKLCPHISPKKSWEGLAGSILFGVLSSLIWFWLGEGQLAGYELTFFSASLLGILLPTVGTLGDLVESVVKRAAQTKDSNPINTGLGGVLDMCDSVLFAAPVLFLYIQFLPRI